MKNLENTYQVECLSCGWKGEFDELEVKMAPAPYYSSDEDMCPNCFSVTDLHSSID